MGNISPALILDFIRTFPLESREAAELDLVVLTKPPYREINCQIQLSTSPEPVGLLEYAIRFGSPSSVELLLEAGADPNFGVPRPLTLLVMTQTCRDDGRIEKMEALLQAGAEADYIETSGHSPPTPLIALARSKAGGIQRYWLGHLLRAAGASVRTANDYEVRVLSRLLAELHAIDGIMECLSPVEQAATKATPSNLTGLVAAVLRSEQPAALDRMIRARHDVKLPLGLDATGALRNLALRIADNPVSPSQAAFVRRLIEAGAETQGPAGENSAFELALGHENHELVEIFIEAGAKPERASAPAAVFELMRRQGLPQVATARPPQAAPRGKALTSLDLLCSGIEGLEACPDSDLHRLTAGDTAALQSLAKRLLDMAERLAPVTHSLPRR
jgi:hypothetical protein